LKESKIISGYPNSVWEPIPGRGASSHTYAERRGRHSQTEFEAKVFL